MLSSSLSFKFYHSSQRLLPVRIHHYFPQVETLNVPTRAPLLRTRLLIASRTTNITTFLKAAKQDDRYITFCHPCTIITMSSNHFTASLTSFDNSTSVLTFHAVVLNLIAVGSAREDIGDRFITLTKEKPHVNVGRSSKNPVKGLEPSRHNAIFDCPIMSRDHARLELINGPSVVSPFS